MDEPDLLAAARYIALNPVAAGLVSHVGDWLWSSARAHLAGEDDELATTVPLRALIPDFIALLAASADPATTARIERVRAIGRPLWRRDGSRRSSGGLAAPRTRRTRTKAASGPCTRVAAAAATDSSKLLP
jgi:putative transposase